MTRKFTLIAAVLTLALSAAAGSAIANDGAKTAGSKRISVKGNYFSPKSITVPAGTTLRFVWAGRLPHNVQGPGSYLKIRVKGSASVKARSGRYVCTLHSGMNLRVKVR